MGLFSHYICHKFVKFSLDSAYSLYEYFFGGKRKCDGIMGIFKSQRVHFIKNCFCHILCLPLLKALVRMCLQGFEVSVDMLSWSPTPIISSVVSPMFYMYKFINSGVSMIVYCLFILTKASGAIFMVFSHFLWLWLSNIQ